MAEKELDEKTQDGDKKPKSNNLLLIIIIIVLALILVIGAVITVMMMGNNDAEGASASTQKEASAHGEEKKTDKEASAEGSHSGSPSTEVGMMYPLDMFTVNLLSESGRRYLKVEMNLELEGEELAMELDSKKPVLRDVIIRLLSSKSLEEISTVKGKETLKDQIVSELNLRIKDGKIKNVYFTDFVVQ